MITFLDFYHVLTAMVPLYAAMALAYASVKWWKIFTPAQCTGINRFVAQFAVPLLCFHVISSNNPYAMNLRFIVADTLQKFIVLASLAVWAKLSARGSLDWTITLFSLSTLPNTLVVGVPLLKGMYGEFSSALMVQIVVLQSIVWCTLLLFMFEYRGARMLISEKFSDTAALITSISVDSDIVSLDERQALETEVVVKDNGMLHVNVRRSSMSRSDTSPTSPHTVSSLTNVEFYSLRSSMNTSPRGSSFNHADYSIVIGSGSRNSSFGANDVGVELDSRRVSNFDEETGNNTDEGGREHDNEKVIAMPSTRIVTRLILVMVWRKLIRNLNSYSSLLGLAWSLISFRWGVRMPELVAKSVSLLSDAGLGTAMFSIGLFTALQPRIIACGYSAAMLAMAVRFLAGPAVMAAASAVVGIRGLLLRLAIVQAALPQGIVPFVFAKEYDLHPNILSTSIIVSMLMALPITLVYYILLAL